MMMMMMMMMIIIIHRRIMDSNLEEMRRVGKPKLRWLDDLVEDLGKLGIQIWWLVATTDRCGRFCGKSRHTVGYSGDDDGSSSS